MAVKNSLVDLKDHMFRYLEDLDDPEKDQKEVMARARVAVDVSRAIVDAARVEVMAVAMQSRLVGGIPSGSAQKQLEGWIGDPSHTSGE